ncbi:hypothetical protein A3709_19780 [Halioglobus sp. HI00S01]|uniref:Hpt domain-containing protein n=1 Tax=Halioglobus sp. HI00S01 TaxID=1822214 RepID=UPI0007C2D6C9|nr:Hpt domain-containing protein [Halioglobus sp. HI00S01]KZX57867.1 hypothetical protein A3709_19780 [Halioglobus sp. HI00S01]
MGADVDIVAVQSLRKQIESQAEIAKKALMEYNAEVNRNDQADAQLCDDLLKKCLIAVYHIGSAYSILGLNKGILLVEIVEYSITLLAQNKVIGERRALTMGGIHQAIAVLPAYLNHVHEVREDTGKGLCQYVNDLSRYTDKKPVPEAVFFYPHYPDSVAITESSNPDSDENIKSAAQGMVVVYVEAAKAVLKKQQHRRENVILVARCANKMRKLFAGTVAERFWTVMIAFCEGVALGTVIPDECVAGIFKQGAVIIKHAFERGADVNPDLDYDGFTRQMLYYILNSAANSRYIKQVKTTFDLHEDMFAEANEGLVHTDALLKAMTSALNYMNDVIDFVHSHADRIAVDDTRLQMEGIRNLQEAGERLIGAGMFNQAERVEELMGRLEAIHAGDEEATKSFIVANFAEDLIQVKADLDYKIKNGVGVPYAGQAFELRQSVVKAMFSQLGGVQDILHSVFRRKNLTNTLARKSDAGSAEQLSLALHRFLNKPEVQDEFPELRELLSTIDSGEYEAEDARRLFELSEGFLKALPEQSEKKCIQMCVHTLTEVAYSAGYAEMTQEEQVIKNCAAWLEAAGEAGEVRENDALRLLADCFAHLTVYLERSIADPLEGDDSHLQSAIVDSEKLLELVGDLGKVSSDGLSTETGAAEIEDSCPDEIREIFIEESYEIIDDLTNCFQQWKANPVVEDSSLIDIRRNFHTFKGNGRAVGALVLGELGWRAQDMLDAVIDKRIDLDEETFSLVSDVIDALPGLVKSFEDEASFDASGARALTNRCKQQAQAGLSDFSQAME